MIIRSVNRLFLTATVLGCFFFAFAAAWGQAPPAADTFVTSLIPSLTNGPSPILAVAPDSTTYIKFNLSGIPAGASVNKAMLRLYVDAILKPGSFDVYELDSSWNENSLAFNTPPPKNGASATGGHPVSITTSNLNQFVMVDVTSLVKAWLNNTVANNGVALALTTNSGMFSFDSKESIFTSHEPELEIVLNGTAGPAGPAGPATPCRPCGPAGP